VLVKRTRLSTLSGDTTSFESLEVTFNAGTKGKDKAGEVILECSCPDLVTLRERHLRKSLAVVCGRVVGKSGDC
jgi:hypothetical protein